MSKRSPISGHRLTAAKIGSFSSRDVKELTDEELREELLLLGKDPGPINAGNRDLYIKQLIKCRSNVTSQESLAQDTAHKQDPTPKGYLTAGASPLSHRMSISKKATSHPKDFQLSGFLAPPVSPFTPDGELNLPYIKTYANLLLKQGVSGVYVNGTTGEGLNLTVEERKIIVEEWKKVSKGRLTIVAQVGAGNVKETCDLAMHANRVGVDCIAVIPPTYYKPPTVESLVLYLEAVSKCVPNLPLYYYHIPKVTGIDFSVESILDMVSEKVPNFCGVKFSSADLPDYNRCISSYGKKYQIIYSSEANLLPALSLGAGNTFVGTQFNFAVKLFQRLLKAFELGDMDTARLEQTRVHSLISIQLKYQPKVGFPGFVKAVMKLKGMDVGPPRLPMLPLSPDDYKALELSLNEIGFFQWS